MNKFGYIFTLLGVASGIVFYSKPEQPEGWLWVSALLIIIGVGCVIELKYSNRK